MFPTRTTWTTGTLRVPAVATAAAATAAAETSFGWATTTPTLSLRVPAPQPAPPPAPVPAPTPPAAPAPGDPVPMAGPEPRAPLTVGGPELAPRAAVREAVPTSVPPHSVREQDPGTASPSDPLGTYPPPRGAAGGPAAQSASAGRDAGTPAAPAGGEGGRALCAPRPGAEDVSASAHRRTAAEHVPTSGPMAVPAPAGQASRPGSAPVERDAGALPASDAVPAPAGQAPVHATAAPEGVPAGPGSRPEDGSAPQSATAARRAGAEAVVPAAREAAESEAQPGIGAGGASSGVPGPGAAEAEQGGVEPPCDGADAGGGNSGVPGPGVAEIVARAVARAMDEDVAAPRRGAAVTEVPLYLPFRAASTVPLPERAPVPAAAPRPARPAPGRRVPRGDDRLREHRGPVLPGWVGVAVGGLALAGCTAVLWRAGILPAPLLSAFGAAPRAYQGLRAVHWPPLAFLGIVALVALGGLGRARTGHAWVLTLFGRYRGTVRRTGLTWVSPLLLRRRVDVRLRHWRSDPMPAVDSGGLALQVVVQVVWQVKDTARATLAVADHTRYLAEQVESAMARVLSQLPADAFHEDAPTLRDAEAVGDALTRMLATETEAVGIEVFSAQPIRIEYAAEVAEAMRRRRVAAIDAKHRDAVLTSVVDAVDDTVHRLTSRGLVELDDYERKALVKDLTVAFYTGRTE